ncbi:MAG: DUF11 domain-containing protein [Betaproteobacteria bacterium]|nr:DUF11 domain-containing protein [Betaproteobacteria bacterium]
MREKFSRALAILAFATATAPVALAQAPAEPLESRLVASKVVLVDGRESLVEATNARPGDVIEYTATYRNAGKEALKGLKATIPIPSQTEFIPGTARPAGVSASLDARLFADVPLKRTVMRDGRQVEEAVPPGEYRALRWLAGELSGGKEKSFSARVRVLDDRPPNDPGGKAGGR